MQTVLTKNDLWIYVSGTCKKPNPDVKNSTTKNNVKRRSDIILSINSTGLKQVKHCEASECNSRRFANPRGRQGKLHFWRDDYMG